MTVRYEDVVKLLKSPATEFSLSPEYLSLGGDMDDLPGVVGASFGKFLCRILDEDQRIGDAEISILELLADSKDARVHEMLRDEIFEMLPSDEASRLMISLAMHNNLLAMYQAWYGGNARH